MTGEKTTPENLLADDHEALDDLLQKLSAALDSRDGASILTQLDLFWARLAIHIRAENLHLFPTLLKIVNQGRGLPTNTVGVREAVAKLRDDHNFFMSKLARAVAVARELPPNLGASGTEMVSQIREIVDSVRLRLVFHNTLEEKFVYGLPERVLSEEDQATLAAGMQRELANLPQRFGPH